MEIHRERPCHPGNYRKGRTGTVEYLVVHYVGAAGSARNNAVYYGSTPGIGASAHYFVGHAGEGAAVWASVPEGDTAWHCGTTGRYYHDSCRNGNSIGVELCCHSREDGSWYFDEETVTAAVELCRDIVERYGIDREHVLRHYDVTHKVCPAPFVADEGAWEAFRGRVFEEEPVAEWAKEAWERVTEAGIMDGSRPRDGVTRQEMAVVVERIMERVGRGVKGTPSVSFADSSLLEGAEGHTGLGG